MSSIDTNLDFSESEIQAQNAVGIEVRAENEFLDTWNCLPAPGLSQGSCAAAVEKINCDGENKVGPGKSKSDLVLVDRVSCQHSGESIDSTNASYTSISSATRPVTLGTSQGKREGSSGNPGHVVRIVVGDGDLKKISETVSPRFLINLFPCSLPCRCCCGRRRELRRVKEANVSMTLEENRRSYRSCVGVKRKLASSMPGDPPVKNGSLNGHYCENNNLLTKAAQDEAVKESGEKQDDALSCFRESRKKRKSKRKHRQRSRGSSTSSGSEIRSKSARGTSGSPKSQERHHRRSSKKSGRKSSNAKHKKAKRSRHRDSSVKRKSSKSKKKKKRHRRRRSRSTPPKTVRASQQLVACCYQSESGSEDEVPCGTATVDSQPDSSLLTSDVANIQENGFDEGNEKVLETLPAVAEQPNDVTCGDEEGEGGTLAGDLTLVEVGKENNTGADEPQELNSGNIIKGTGQSSSTNDTLENIVLDNVQGESSTSDKEPISGDTEASQDMGQKPLLGNTPEFDDAIPIAAATGESIGTEQQNVDVRVPEERMPEENIPLVEVKTPVLPSSPSPQYQVSAGDKIIIEMNGMHTGSSPFGREGVKISIEPITSVEMDSLGQSSLLCSASASEKPTGSSPLGPTHGSRSRSLSSSSSSSYRSRTRSTKSYRSYSSRSYSSSRSRSRSSVSTRSAASHRTKSRSPSFSSQSRSRSRSRSSRSRTRSRTRSVSKSSRSKSRSISRSVTRSRSRSPVKPVKKVRSRSRSIPRRRGSPSFLERRRITSARKRPISYKRKPGSEWEVSSESESSDSSL